MVPSRLQQARFSRAIVSCSTRMTKVMEKVTAKASLGQVQVSPMTLVCPMCGAKPGYACETASGGALEIIHVTRIKAAAAKDAAMKKQHTR